MTPRADARPIRVKTRIDTRLLFKGMFGKFRAFANWRVTSEPFAFCTAAPAAGDGR